MLFRSGLAAVPQNFLNGGGDAGGWEGYDSVQPESAQTPLPKVAYFRGSLGGQARSGYNIADLVDAQTGASRVMKFTMMSRAANVWLQSQNQWYAWDQNPPTFSDSTNGWRSGWWFEPGSRGISRKAAAFITLVNRMKSSASATCTNIGGVWTVNAYDATNGTVFTAKWLTELFTNNVAYAGGYDVYGNSWPYGKLTDEPVFSTSGIPASPPPPPPPPTPTPENRITNSIPWTYTFTPGTQVRTLTVSPYVAGQDVWLYTTNQSVTVACASKIGRAHV